MVGHIMFGPAFGGVRDPRFPRLVREEDLSEIACRKENDVRHGEIGSVEPYIRHCPILWLC